MSIKKEIERREEANKWSPFPVYDTEKINELKIKEKMESKKEKYNEVPVTYCKTCLSLHVKTVKFNKGTEEGISTDYCGECSSTEMGTGFIDEWEELYVEMYGEKFLKDVPRKV